MLRAAAVEALARRDAERRVEAARRALSDDYPRVRTEAVRVLDAADQGDDVLAALAREDSWPMVRAAAVEALWDRPSGRAVVRAAVRDRSQRVRRSAVLALARARDREAWPLVRARLADANEWPQVTVAALRYVHDLCLREASDALVAVIRRGLEPEPFQPDVDVAAVAVDLALLLGGPRRRRRAASRIGPTSRRACARPSSGGSAARGGAGADSVPLQP
ncbi:MAG: HEAT repeat domain-containing protein [Sandaracinaceae bacterium]|nr:HEAT repeat domain-containing protein [Sandaracinaceae bacterium]